MNVKQTLAAAVVLTTAGLAFAQSAPAPQSDATKTIALQDGSTLYVFSDGKMGMADKFGRAVMMPEGQVMEAKDGQTIRMEGSESARTEALLRATYGYGA